MLVSAWNKVGGVTKRLTLIRPRITTTDPNTPFAGMMSIVSLTILKTPIAASKDEIVHDLSFGLGGFVLAGTELAIVGEGGQRKIDNGGGGRHWRGKLFVPQHFI